MPSLKSAIDSFSLDDVCSLVSKTYDSDQIGQQRPTEVKRMIFCTEKSVTRQEFFAAGNAGLKSIITLIVDSDEYDGEPMFEYHNKKYTVYRYFMRSDGFTELYGEVRMGG